ncbi:M16 family metallopeptidase [Clostridium massiliodielmoense]|uniref:M16 family metallopeptidase n=1 Tax=Clostridium massiliodielmoense TaxID=1776385 RepID=UPI0004DAD278|nr:pitrilysin family protein [Clostridium massiliodielmoense]KEH97371.1 peptidase M16 [Clostridium botulinum C/D str. BKT12695]
MKKHILKNGINLYYVKREGNISSFCIGFNAGALVERKKMGIAHAVEHMVFKGTKNNTESEINSICDRIFGFNNAMTNYPYVIYYGTTLSSDFNEGFSVYSDIVLNPIFPQEGFKEEINVILEELKEWKDDPYQECEDELFYNAFKQRRIKELIIGNRKSVSSITLDDIRKFYEEYYVPNNCVISVVSSLEFDEVLHTVNKYFDKWNRRSKLEDIKLYENNVPGIYTKIRNDLNGAKIQYCFPIHSLSDEEIKILKIFNSKFGDGTSSILFDEVRTKNGLVYDIRSNIKNENGIKLFTITLGTSKDNIEKSIELINKNIEDVKYKKGIFTEECINNIIKNINLKKELSLERSIELSKKIVTEKIMFNSTKGVFNEFVKNKTISEDKVLTIISKILKNPSIQVLMPE